MEALGTPRMRFADNGEDHVVDETIFVKEMRVSAARSSDGSDPLGRHTSSQLRTSAPVNLNEPMWETSNKPAPARVAKCSSLMLEYQIGNSNP